MSDPIVSIIMGSVSDWDVMSAAAHVMESFDVPFEKQVVSAHRTPMGMADYANNAHARGVKVIIAGAGGAAHLPGMVASITTLPVIGVPVESKSLKGQDSLLSIAQMPPGIPVATMAINGAKNAGLMAIRILALNDILLLNKLRAYRDEMVALVATMNEALRDVR